MRSAKDRRPSKSEVNNEYAEARGNEQVNEMTWTSCPTWFWYPAAIHSPLGPAYGTPRMRVYMKPEVITSMMATVTNAHDHLFRIMGEIERRRRAIPRALIAITAKRVQSMGAL